MHILRHKPPFNLEARIKAIESAQRRIERKLDTLIAISMEDDEQEESFDLDGNPVGGQRDTTESL